jgi:hypothetical protein
MKHKVVLSKTYTNQRIIVNDGSPEYSETAGNLIKKE